MDLAQALRPSRRLEIALFCVQVAAVITNVAVLYFLYLQTSHMSVQTHVLISQTEEMRNQTDEAIAARNAMIAQTDEMKEQTSIAQSNMQVMSEQLSQMQRQTEAMNAAHIPQLRFLPTGSKDIANGSDGWTYGVNILNSGSRAAFNIRLCAKFSVLGRSIVDTIYLQPLPAGSSVVQVLPILEVDTVRLGLDLSWYRAEEVESGAGASPYYLSRALVISHSKTDSAWSVRLDSRESGGIVGGSPEPGRLTNP